MIAALRAWWRALLAWFDYGRWWAREELFARVPAPGERYRLKWQESGNPFPREPIYVHVVEVRGTWLAYRYGTYEAGSPARLNDRTEAIKSFLSRWERA